MGRAADPPSDRSGRGYKLGRLIQEYDLQPMGAELERRWTAAGEARSSHRNLSTYVNRCLLTAAMTEACMHLIQEPNASRRHQAAEPVARQQPRCQ